MAAATPCITGSFDIPVFDGECNYVNVLQAFEQHTFNPVNIGFECDNTPAQELALLLGLGANDDATDAVYEQICKSAWDSAPTVAFEKIRNAMDGEYYEFASRYYNGGTEWNEQTETLYPDGERRYVLREDAARVRDFYENDAENARVTMPVTGAEGNPLPNFDSCEHNAIYCCWSRDRQARDNNGNCNTEYDLNCIDKDPADNTDLCYVDYSRSSDTTGFGEGGRGFINYPFDNNDGEGAIHCHGLAWSEDPYHPSARYKGNNLFFVSMYDHMTQRGYVENVPGAPMCACAEQMPIVTRSDCTQIDVEESYEVSYDGTSFSAKLVDVLIDFNSCRGWNNQNNDLWAYMQRLYYEDKEVSSDKLAGLSKSLVEDNNCHFVFDAFMMSEYKHVTGYEHNPRVWTQVAGRDSMEAPSYGKQGFKVVSEEGNHGVGMIMRRTCASCDTHDHLNIYYKRLTPVPEGMDLLFELKNRRGTVTGNVYGTDFHVYGSYEDALAETNEWACVNYNHGEGFPGDCAPNGGRETSQESRFEPWYGWKSDVGWYVETPAAADFALTKLDERAAQDIGNPQYAGQTLTDNEGTYYMSATGSDIWGYEDHFQYMSETMDASQDFSVEVLIPSLDYQDYWTKACIMVRDSLDSDAVHFDICLTGRGGVVVQIRRDTGGSTGASKEYDDLSLTRDNVEGGPLNAVRLKLVKRDNTYRGMWMYANESPANGDDWRTWRVPDEMTNLGLSGSVQVGLALTSHDNYISEVVFKDYTITTGLKFDPLPEPVVPPYTVGTALAVGSDAFHVGETALEGSATFVAPDTYHVSGSGQNIYNNQDNFFFAVPARLSGDFIVTAKFSRYSGYNGDWAKAGLMIRSDVATGKESHASAILQSQKGVAFISRDGDGAWSSKARKSEAPLDSVWLRLEKVGTKITCYESLTDVKAWRYTATRTMTSWAGTDATAEYYVGMAVSSASPDLLASATFEHFEIVEL